MVLQETVLMLSHTLNCLSNCSQLFTDEHYCITPPLFSWHVYPTAILSPGKTSVKTVAWPGSGFIKEMPWRTSACCCHTNLHLFWLSNPSGFPNKHCLKRSPEPGCGRLQRTCPTSHPNFKLTQILGLIKFLNLYIYYYLPWNASWKERILLKHYKQVFMSLCFAYKLYLLGQ